MVLMRLIKADKRLAERIQQKLNFSNYQMLLLNWAIGLVMRIAIAIPFFLNHCCKRQKEVRDIFLLTEASKHYLNLTNRFSIKFRDPKFNGCLQKVC